RIAAERASSPSTAPRPRPTAPRGRRARARPEYAINAKEAKIVRERHQGAPRGARPHGCLPRPTPLLLSLTLRYTVGHSEARTTRDWRCKAPRSRTLRRPGWASPHDDKWLGGAEGPAARSGRSEQRGIPAALGSDDVYAARRRRRARATDGDAGA